MFILSFICQHIVDLHYCCVKFTYCLTSPYAKPFTFSIILSKSSKGLHLKTFLCISIIFIALGCYDDKTINHSAPSVSSSSQFHSLPVFDSRVVSYRISSPNLKTTIPWAEELSDDSLIQLFPKAMATKLIDSSCSYLVIGTNHMEGLSYYILSSPLVNSDTLILHNIHPALNYMCMYPQSIDSHQLLLCDKSGSLKSRIVLKVDTVYDPNWKCTSSPFSTISDSIISF